MSKRLSNIKLLQASVDTESESDIRVLVDGKFVKYLTIDPGVYNPDDMCFEPYLTPNLPSLPPGDWNNGHISRNAVNGRPYFASIAKTQFPGITDLWHPLQIDHLELKVENRLRSNIYEVTSSRFKSKVIAKFARFSWEIPELAAETSAYRWIENCGIGPRFFGHISEEGRIIGFLIERIAPSRHAEIKDLSLCQLVISRLHKMGIKHGDTNKHNFLIHDGKVTLIDFDFAERCKDVKVLEKEYRDLREKLLDTSGRGGQRVISDLE